MSRRARAEGGQSIIEVLVALSLLAVGLIAVVALVGAGELTTSTNLGREGASTLAHDLLERTRQVSYASLAPSTGTQATTLRGQLGDASATAAVSGSQFRLTRRNVEYTVTVTSCLVDNPADGLALRSGTTWCTTGAATNPADANGDDMTQVSVQVGWRTEDRAQVVKQVAVVPNPEAT